MLLEEHGDRSQATQRKACFLRARQTAEFYNGHIDPVVHRIVLLGHNDHHGIGMAAYVSGGRIDRHITALFERQDGR